jgi:acyl dehydratase
MEVITDEARAWAEREYPPFEFTVTAHDIARFARSIGAADPIHFDRAAAIAAGFDDIVAPSLFTYVVRMHASTLIDPSLLEEDGSPSNDVPPLSTKRAMAGGVSMEVDRRIIAGDVITVERRLTDLYEKEGRSGPLVFLEFEFSFHNQRGEPVARERFTRIFR